jgi:hypothetical protein
MAVIISPRTEDCYWLAIADLAIAFAVLALVESDLEISGHGPLWQVSFHIKRVATSERSKNYVYGATG